MGIDIKNIIKGMKSDILKMFYHSRSGHLASAVSCLEILATLFFMEKRPLDKVVLSKGHGAAALYAVLAQKNIVSHAELKTFYGKNSRLLALASPTVEGIEIPTGSLGQGICFAAGVAKACQMDQKDTFVYCVLGDGEMQEGCVWETALFAAQHKLHRFIVILDYNRIQASNHISSIIEMEPVAEKWRSFGWGVWSVDGHNPDAIRVAIDKAKEDAMAPSLIIAHTHKGNGIRSLSDQSNCHMLIPPEEAWEQICKDLDLDFEELKEYAK